VTISFSRGAVLHGVGYGIWVMSHIPAVTYAESSVNFSTRDFLAVTNFVVQRLS